METPPNVDNELIDSIWDNVFLEENSENLCKYCSQKGNGRYCDAFDLIPNEILSNKVDHRKPIEGDRNIQFEPNPGVDPSKLDRLFK